MRMTADVLLGTDGENNSSPEKSVLSSPEPVTVFLCSDRSDFAEVIKIGTLIQSSLVNPGGPSLTT